MREISCDVTKDLLPGFLDEVCSEESRELVRDHLAGCPACREFLRQLQAAESVEKTPEKVDFLRKLRRSEWYWALFLFGMAVTIVLTATLVTVSAYRGRSHWGYCLAMIVLSLTAARVLLSKPETTRAGRGGWLCLGGAAALLLYYLALLALVAAVEEAMLQGSDRIPFGMEASEMGPFLARNLCAIMLASAVLAGFALAAGKAEARRWIVALQLLWLDLTAALSLRSYLYQMEKPEGWMGILTRYLFLFAAEAAVLGGVCLWMRRRRLRAG